MIGAIFCDIAGSIYEFNNTFDYNFPLLSKDCSFTDDTICTVAIADAILKGVSYKDSLVNWYRRYPGPMGSYGSSFNLWFRSPDHLPYHSYGNGAAMRVSPVGWAFPLSEVECEVQATADVSHNHPEGERGAKAVAKAICLLRENKERLSEQRKELVCQIAEEFYGKHWISGIPRTGYFGVTCQGCVPLSFKIFLIVGISKMPSGLPFSTVVIPILLELL